MISYARNAEDAVLARPFARPSGFYVDVGAGDPDVDSVTRHFYDQGWRGLNIEPRGNAWTQLTERRPGDINLQVAAGSSNGTGRLYVVRDEESLSTINDAQADRLRQTGHRLQVQDVQVRTLDAILSELAPPGIDFLRIAVQSAEEAMLAGLDLRRWRPRVIIALAPRMWINERLDDAWRKTIEAHGYVERLFDGVNTFFVAEEATGSIGPLQPASALDDFTRVAEQQLRDELARHEQAQREVAAYVRELEARLTATSGPPPAAPPSTSLASTSLSSTESASLRLMVISKPEADGAALARRLAALSGMTVHPATHPADLDWHALPERFVVHLDWPPSEWLVRLVATYGIRVLAVPDSSSDESKDHAAHWCARPTTIRVDASRRFDDEAVLSLLREVGVGHTSGEVPVQRKTLSAGDRMRVAIIGTPRSGNTWVRRVLADAFALRELPVDRPGDVDWSHLPPRCIIQLHWFRTKDLESTLAAHGFIVISPARHPLDVLLSILVFVNREGGTREWLDGAGGDEQELLGARAGSAAFVRYAKSERASKLLAVTPEWWASGDVVRVAYEELQRNPAAHFQRIAAALGEAASDRLTAAIETNTPARLSRLSRGVHVWTARAGMHRELLTASTIVDLAQTHRAAFEQLGYPLPARLPLPSEAAGLTDDEPRVRWS